MIKHFIDECAFENHWIINVDESESLWWFISYLRHYSYNGDHPDELRLIVRNSTIIYRKIVHNTTVDKVVVRKSTPTKRLDLHHPSSLDKLHDLFV